jgi:hypothetical protein
VGNAECGKRNVIFFPHFPFPIPHSPFPIPYSSFPTPDLCDLSIVSGKMPVATLMIADQESLPTHDPQSAI